MNLLELSVSLVAKGFKDVDRQMAGTERQAESTNRSIERLRANAAKGVEFRAKAEETGFAALIKRFAQTRTNAARGATFETRAESEGFEQARGEIERTRSAAANDAELGVTAKQTGFPAVIQWIVRTRSAASQPADMRVRASESGFSEVNSAISGTSGAADRLDGKSVNLRASLAGGDQVRSGLEAISLRSDRLDGGQVVLTTDLRNGRRVIQELQNVEGVSSRIDGDQAIITARVDGTQRGITALNSLGAAASRVDNDDVRLAVNVTGTGAAIGELQALNSAVNRVDGRSIRVNAGPVAAASRLFTGLSNSITDTATRIRSFGTIIPTIGFPLLLGGLGAIPGAALAASASLAGLIQRAGQGLAGAAVIGGTAIGGLAAGLYAYVGAAKAAVSGAMLVREETRKASNEQLAQQRIAILNTAAAQRFNDELDRQVIALTKVQAELGNRVLPGFTRMLGLFRGQIPTLTPPLYRLASGVTRVAEDFAKFALSGRGLGQLRNVLDFVADSGIRAAKMFSNLGRFALGAIQPVIPAANRLNERLLGLTRRMGDFAQSAEGSRKIAKVVAVLERRFYELLEILKNVGIGIRNVFDSISGAGVSDQAWTGLQNISRGFARATAEGTQFRAQMDGFMRSVRSTMPFISSLLGTVFSQIGRIANATLGMRNEGEKLTVMQQMFKSLEPAVRAVATLLINSFRNFAPLLGPVITEVARFLDTLINKNPVAKGFLTTMLALLRAFNNLPQPAKSAIVSIGSLVSILAGLGIATKVIGFLARLNPAFRLLSGGATRSTGAVSRFGGALSRLGGWISRAVGSIGRFAANMGRGLVSVVSRAAGGVGRLLQFIGPRLVGAFTRLGAVLRNPMTLFRALGGIFARIVPLVARFAPWLARIGVAALGLSNPIGWVVTAITLLGTAFVIAYRRSERFRNIVNSVGRFLQRLAQGALRLTVAGLRMLWRAIQPVIAWMGRAAVAVGKFAARLAVGTIRTYVRVLGAIWRAVRPVIVWLGKAALAVGRFAARLAVGTIRTYVRVLGAIWRAVRPVIAWLGKAAAAVGRFVGRLAVGALRLFGRMLTALWRAAKPVLAWMGRAAVAVGKFVGRLAVKALRLFGRFLGVLWRAVKPVIAWLGRAAVAVGKFLGRLVIKGLKQWGRWLRSIWNAAKPVVQWLGKAAVAVGKFLARLAVKALRNFWRGLKTIWNGAKTLIGWIGKGARAVGNFATKVFNAAKNMRGTWRNFWIWAKKLWKNSLGALFKNVKQWGINTWERIKRITGNILGVFRNFWNKRVKPLFRNSLGDLFGNVKRWGINTWERFKRIAGNIFGIWRNFYNKRIKPLFKTSLSDLFGNVKAWGINTWERFKRIAGNIFGIWKNFYNKRIKPLFKNSLGDLFGNVKQWGINTWERFKRIAGNIFDIWKNFWNKRIKPLFSGSFGDLTDAAKKWATNFIKPFGRAVNKIRQWLGGLATALANVLSALGMDKFAKNLRGRAGKLKAPLTFARGGIARAKDGPGIVAEAGDDEAVVNLRKRTPESQRAFRAAQDSPNAPQHNRGGRPPTNAPNVAPGYPPPHGAHSHDHEQLSRSELRHKQQGVRGAHPDFSRNHKNVYDYVRDRANRAANAASGVSWNTYHHHITSPGANEHSSVDFWGGAPGRAIGKSKGDKVANFVRNNLAQGNLGTIWNRKFSRGGGPFRPWSGGPHTNHVHVGWSTDKDAKIVSGGGVGGAFSGVMDALGNAYNSVTDFISQKFKPPEIPDLGGGPFFSGLAEGLKSSILGRATDWITDKATEMLSIGSGGSGSGEYASGKTLREWAKNGLTHGGVFAPNEDNVRRTAEQAQIESGGNPKAANNWDINAIRGNPSKGLMQVIKTTWNANTTPGIGGFDANWDDPVKSVAVASRYVASRYGKIANIWPTRGGYDRGGVIPGTPGEPRVIRAHAGERVLPASLARGFEVLARALDRFSALGRGSALERVAQALTRALGGSRGLRVQRPARNRQHRAPRRTLSQRVRAWNDQPDAQRFRKGVPDELERDARAAGYSLAEDLTFVRSGFYGNARTQRPRVQPRTNRLPVNSAQVARNVQINAGMSTAALEREIQGLKNDLVQTLNNNAAKPTFIGNWVEGERTMLNSQRSKAGREVQRQNAEDEVNRKLNRMR